MSIYIATKLHQCLAELNQTLNDAALNGIKVELEVLDFTNIKHSNRCLNVKGRAFIELTSENKAKE